MSIDWFRSWHGAPTDPKWLLIAKRSETQAGVVSAIVWALFDFASQNSADRGSVEAFDAETYAAFSGFEEGTIKRIIECLKEKKLINNGHLSAWEKRQPKREDNSTARVQEYRNAMKRNETQNPPREEKIREEKKDAAPDGAQGSKPEKVFFDQANQYLGNGGRALAAKLLKAKGGNVMDAHAALLTAVQKSNPREYLGAIIRTREGAECRPDRSF